VGKIPAPRQAAEPLPAIARHQLIIAFIRTNNRFYLHTHTSTFPSAATHLWFFALKIFTTIHATAGNKQFCVMLDGRCVLNFCIHLNCCLNCEHSFFKCQHERKAGGTLAAILATTPKV